MAALFNRPVVFGCVFYIVCNPLYSLVIFTRPNLMYDRRLRDYSLQKLMVQEKIVEDSGADSIGHGGHVPTPTFTNGWARGAP